MESRDNIKIESIWWVLAPFVLGPLVMIIPMWMGTQDIVISLTFGFIFGAILGFAIIAILDCTNILRWWR
jgi:uncharacterized membrane protein YdjX (TVP38/TMEM64 family)